jgi:ABC-type transporter Mla maintaining outer membrane lipid asymmetry permease subunit MlaE
VYAQWDLVITLQSRPTLGQVYAEPGYLAYCTVFNGNSSALICAGKSSGICAELGSMKVTEQIDAMEVSL